MQSVTWEVPQLKGTPPAARSGHTFSVVGTKAYLFGGTGRKDGTRTQLAQDVSQGIGGSGIAVRSSEGASEGLDTAVLRGWWGAVGEIRHPSVRIVLCSPPGTAPIWMIVAKNLFVRDERRGGEGG